MSAATTEAASGRCLPAAKVRWDGRQCLSEESGDRYFSPDGAAEVTRVFMSPVGLAERFRSAKGTFTCGELGFGTGLNLAVLAGQFCALAPATARLHVISFERAPLSGADMRAMARHWQTEHPVYAEIAEHYPPLLSGWHRLHLCGGRVCLSLYFGDARDGLADISGRQRLPVDHWLLDGFAPPKNPSLWQPELLALLASFAAPGTSIATYSAVGRVRRSLEELGFAMRKVDQMPIKLHSLAGTFEDLAAGCGGRTRFQPPDEVQILGGGIAGASIARGLADRGIATHLVEPGGQLARYASRIPAAALHGRLRDDGSTGAAWQVASYHYSHHRLQAFAGYRATGTLQICGPNTSPERLAALLSRYSASGNWLEARAKVDTPWRAAEAGLHFDIGGTVRGPTLINALVDHPLIHQAICVRPTNRSTGAADTPMTVLANGFASRNHDAACYLEIAALPGQAELCGHTAPPREPIVGAGYIAPCRGGMVIGSTYEYSDWLPDDARQANLAPWLNTGRHRASFRGNRTITSDRVAIIGALFDRDGAPVPGLRVSTGFGSTGMSSAPLAGECIAAELAGEFAPVTRELSEAVSSERFRERQARRGVRMGAQERVGD